MTSTTRLPPILVGYLGPKASFSHQAARQLFQASTTKQEADLKPIASFPQLFESLLSQSVNYSILPLENSTNGPVQLALDLIASNASADIRICGETTVRVKPCLAGRQKGWSRGKPSPTNKTQKTTNPDLSHIKSLHTHPQAWSQCTPFLNEHFGPEITRQNEDSTSGAAEIVAADETGTKAAICSQLAAEVFELDILATDIESEVDNETRFLVLRRTEDPIPPPLSNIEQGNGLGTRKGLLVCEVLSTKGVQILQQTVRGISSDMVRVHWRLTNGSWAYVFFNDVDEHIERFIQHFRTVLEGEEARVWDWGRWMTPASSL